MTRRGFVSLLAPMIAGAQDFSEVRIEKIAAGFVFTEGPVWSRDGFLLFSDVPNDVIHKWVPGEGTSVYRKPTNKANGNTFDNRGRLLSCESKGRRVVRELRDGKLEVVAEKWEGKRLNAPNDITVRKDGHIYFTDPAFGDQAEGRELDFYGVYHVTPRGEMRLIAKPEGRPNGIALSPDGRILYVNNSDERNVRAYGLDRQGVPSNERVLISDIQGSPDGMRVDEKGNLYVTANALDIFSPEGKLVHRMEFPEMPRNCAFGDADFQTLFVTARTSVYRVRLDVKGAVHY